ncbi:DNA cytosine methyltransferase, partial [Clostridioides difficile]
MLTFLDLFAGIGGFRLGMEKAGHKCLGHCEYDKFANLSYNAMHKPKEDEWFERDI